MLRRPPISTLSLHDALPISAATLRMSRDELLNATGLTPDQLRELEQFGMITSRSGGRYDDDALAIGQVVVEMARYGLEGRHLDRKSTRLNSSHPSISYAVFC